MCIRDSSILVYLLGDEEAAIYAAIVSDMLERGALDARIQQVLPLAEVAHAHRLVEAGDRAGAVILSTA